MVTRILIADDDHDAADTLAMVLQRLEFAVEVAYSGEQVLCVAPEFNPDVFILDLVMPACDGFQVARRLRSAPQFANRHFIALTGHADERCRDEASKAQFDDYLVKPCPLNLLMKIIAEGVCLSEANKTPLSS